MFHSYKIKRYNPEYKKYLLLKHLHDTFIMNNVDRYSELCKECGHTLGEHSGMDHCPGESGYNYTSVITPIFLSDNINKNIVVL